MMAVGKTVWLRPVQLGRAEPTNPRAGAQAAIDPAPRRWFPPSLVLVMACAGVLYSFRLAFYALGGSEAYTAYAASQTTIAMVLDVAWRFDPGKLGLYQVLLHWLCAIFGNSELTLRAVSVLCTIAQLPILYAIGTELFGSEVALTATILWGFSPLAAIFAQWARMYSMYTTAVLANLLVFWRLRENPGRALVAASAITGAAMLYTHLAAGLFLIAAAALLIRDLYRGRGSAAPWMGIIGIALALAATVPVLPIALPQAHEFLFGHTLDWIAGERGGPAGGFAIAGVGGTAILAGIGIVLIFGRIREADEREPIRWCLIWAFLPIAPFIAGSLLLRPLFAVRYLLPAAPALALLAAEILHRAGARVRNLGTAMVATAFVVIFVQSQPMRYQPWREISERVAKGMADEPVFFESGPAISHERGSIGRSNQFPQGYFRPAFDYYFKGPNPRIAFDPGKPLAARELIARSAGGAGGAWLLSCKGDAVARAELPDGSSFAIEPMLPYQHGWLYHVVPRNAPNTLARTRFPRLSP